MKDPGKKPPKELKKDRPAEAERDQQQRAPERTDATKDEAPRDDAPITNQDEQHRITNADTGSIQESEREGT